MTEEPVPHPQSLEGLRSVTSLLCGQLQPAVVHRLRAVTALLSIDSLARHVNLAVSSPDPNGVPCCSRMGLLCDVARNLQVEANAGVREPSTVLRRHPRKERTPCLPQAV